MDRFEEIKKKYRKRAWYYAHEEDVKWLITEVERLEQWVNDLQSHMYINCVYCGHRYGPDPGTPVAMADVLKQHIEQCPKHPLSAMKIRAEKAEAELDAQLTTYQARVKEIDKLEAELAQTNKYIEVLTSQREAVYNEGVEDGKAQAEKRIKELMLFVRVVAECAKRKSLVTDAKKLLAQYRKAQALQGEEGWTDLKR